MLTRIDLPAEGRGFRSRIDLTAYSRSSSRSMPGPTLAMRNFFKS